MSHLYANLLHFVPKHSVRFGLAAIFLSVFSLGNGQEPDLCSGCNTNHFQAQLLDQSIIDDCMTRTLEIKVDKDNKFALSHLVIEVPCGVVTSASNSRNWKTFINMKDPKSGIYGIKIDDINGFGDRNKEQTFTVTYTVCGIINCSTTQATEPFDLVYKASICHFTQTINPQPSIPPTTQLNGTIIPQHILCYGQSEGTVMATATGGTRPYTYLWNNGSIDSTITNVSAGVYSVTITDADSSQITLSTEVLQPATLTASARLTPSLCSMPTGVAEIIVGGGTAPYTYLWSNGHTTSKNSNIPVGKYTVTVTDANGCTLTRTYYIEQNTNLSVSLTAPILECHQQGHGSITATATGGTAPYTYNWSNGESTQNINNLSTGQYSVTVTDGEGCTAILSTYVSIKQLTATASVQAPNCQGDNTGSATITVANGTAPYTYNWSNGNNTSSMSGLSSGWYFVDITDANGCTASKAVQIPTTTALTIKTEVTANSCEAGDNTVTVKLSSTGGTAPYIWLVNGATSSSTFVSEAPNTLQITVMDANGCSVTTNTNITYPNTSISATVNVVQSSCNSATGSATIGVAGATQPVTAVWPDGYVGFTRSDLTSGTYTVMLTDGKGCTSSVNVNIQQTELPTVEIDSPSAQEICGTSGNIVTAVAPTAVSAQWSISSTANDWVIESTNLLLMTYKAGTGSATISITVTDANGCQATDTLVMSCEPNTDNPDDGNGGDGGGNNDNGSNNGGGNTNSCNMADNYWVKTVERSTTCNGCYTYKITVYTDGRSEHELSHFVIGIPSGSTVKSITVSRSWTVEKNVTDPKSGVYGIKIDNISGFGQSGADSFTVEHTICNNNQLINQFTLVYKAATCQWNGTANFNPSAPNDDVVESVDSYPNPFKDRCTFKVKTKKDCHVDFYVSDVSGNRCANLYKGQMKQGVVYKLEFDASQRPNGFYFYKMVTPAGTKQGKIMKR